MATQVSETTKIADQDRWDLASLYPSDDSWERARVAFEARLDEIDKHRGHLGDSPRSLLEALTRVYDLRRDLNRLSSYARMKSDLDRRDAASLARSSEIEVTGTKLDGATAFIAPELLALPEGTIRRFLEQEPRLAPYAQELDDVVRKRPHTLSPGEEKLLADAGILGSTADNVYGVLASADLPWPQITLAGQKVRLDQSAYAKHRAAENRADRLEVFRTFFSTWQAYARTFGVTLDAEVKKSIFFARARRYPGALSAALDRNHVPVGVYDAMIAAAHEGLPTLHRYFKLRARLLGVTDLGYHDIYAPLAPSGARQYTFPEARAMVLEALAPMGREYVATLRKGLESRWVDVWPSTGKRSGAYSNGSIYDDHPFILMNYNGNFDGVSTLAHEGGHAMHSWLANHAQPFPNADYSIFVAEVASTFNEALLERYAIDRAKDDEERLGLLSQKLDGLRGTFFRQAMFAEFEREIYRVAEGGETLTGERLGEIYLDLLRKYHGSAQGVCAIDDLYRVEWAYIPHFYSNFYVFQYSTGYAASTALARRVLAGEAGATERYLDFLRAGSSDYPYPLLQKAGVDLARPDPYRETIAEMNRTLDEVDGILARRSERKR